MIAMTKLVSGKESAYNQASHNSLCNQVISHHKAGTKTQTTWKRAKVFLCKADQYSKRLHTKMSFQLLVKHTKQNHLLNMWLNKTQNLRCKSNWNKNNNGTSNFQSHHKCSKNQSPRRNKTLIGILLTIPIWKTRNARNIDQWMISKRWTKQCTKIKLKERKSEIKSSRKFKFYKYLTLKV